MARRVTLETNLGDIRDHTAEVFEELAARYEIYFAWGIGDSGDHKAGKALDLMAYERGGGPQKPGPIRPDWNRAVAHYVWDNRKRLGVNYVIYDQLIQSNNPDGYAYGGWNRYPGKSHANHVHISFEEKPPAYRPPPTPDKEEVLAGITLSQIENVVRNVVRQESRVNVSEARQEASGYAHDTYDAESILLDTSWRIRALTKIVESLAEAQGPATRDAVRSAINELLSADVDINVELKPIVDIPDKDEAT